MKQLFLKSDQEKANKELDCYGYLLNKGIELFMQADFDKAAVYHENIARTLKELGRMKNKRETHDRAWFLLKQIEAEQIRRELIHLLKVNRYD